MTYSDALKRGDTQGQHRAHEREKRATHAALIRDLRKEGSISARRATALRKKMGLA